MILYRATVPELLALPEADTAGTPITSAWLSSAALQETDVKPAFLKERPFSFAEGFQHVMHRDAAGSANR